MFCRLELNWQKFVCRVPGTRRTQALPSARRSGTRQRANKLFFLNGFAECPWSGTRQSPLIYIYIYILQFCQVLSVRHSTKTFFKKQKNHLPSAWLDGTQQTIFLHSCKKYCIWHSNSRKIHYFKYYCLKFKLKQCAFHVSWFYAKKTIISCVS